ncbi:MAG: GNAT family N-acetyltransferase [Lachnospiraceae bacterium]|nr:GNAT family N-acetyltransferase [Lachnospiraceae bacterium oral taxon 082]MDU5597572.1 GNAT family N-acetyltransferase [Lachnospiraceae bacterium]
MQSLKSVNIKGKHCDIVISDENVALWEAFNSHRATVAVLGNEDIDIAVSKYAVYDFFDIDEEYLEKVACRHLHIPVCIGKVDDIKIRELCTEDFDSLSKFCEFPFKNIEGLREYIDFHYDFYGYGLYVFENEKEVMGLAGFYNEDNRCFLSYITDKKYRRRGYTFKVCKYLLKYIEETYGAGDVYTRIDISNTASINLADKLGVNIVN